MLFYSGTITKAFREGKLPRSKSLCALYKCS